MRMRGGANDLLGGFASVAYVYPKKSEQPSTRNVCAAVGVTACGAPGASGAPGAICAIPVAWRHPVDVDRRDEAVVADKRIKFFQNHEKLHIFRDGRR